MYREPYSVGKKSNCSILKVPFEIKWFFFFCLFSFHIGWQWYTEDLRDCDCCKPSVKLLGRMGNTLCMELFFVCSWGIWNTTYYMWYWSSLKASSSSFTILKTVVPWWHKNLETLFKLPLESFIHNNEVLSTVYFIFTKKSVVLWRRAPWWCSHSCSIDSHPLYFGTDPTSSWSCLHHILLLGKYDWMKAIVCLTISPASDIHSQCFSHSFMHIANGHWVLIVSQKLFYKNITRNQDKKANTNYKWHILVMKTFIDIYKLCTLIQMLIHSDLPNNDKYRERVSQMFPIMLVCKVWETE